MSRRLIRLFACLLLLWIGLSLQGSAQVNTASLTGLVTDPSGAVLPNATVMAKNNATNVISTAETSASGYYTFASLPVGAYTLTVQVPGFKKSVREGVVLEVGQKGRIDFTLEVGAPSETAIVVEMAPILTTQEATTGGVIENRLMTDLPLAARNWDDLAAMVPGTQADRYTEEGGGTSAGRTGGVNVHGIRSLQNNFVLDGVDNNSISENVQELTTQIASVTFRASSAEFSTGPGRQPTAG